MLPSSRVRILSDRVVITLQDGGIGDDDGIVNGHVVDPGGLVALPTVVPTSIPAVLPRTGSGSSAASGIAAIAMLLGVALLLAPRRCSKW